MTPRHVDFYSIPVIYDILHAPGTPAEFRSLRTLARRFAPRPPSGKRPVWLEPACGTGRLLRAAAAHGVRAIGFDREPLMIAHARRLARKAEHRPAFFVADMEAFDEGRRIPRVHMAFNLINTIRHLGSDAAMLRHFRAIERVLAPGGIYAVGLHMTAYGLESPTEEVWRGRAGPTRVIQVLQYLPPAGSRGESLRAERAISHVTMTQGGETEHIDSTYALRSYSLGQWLTLLDRSPLGIMAVTDHAGVDTRPHEPGYFVFVLVRRSERGPEFTAPRPSA